MTSLSPIQQDLVRNITPEQREMLEEWERVREDCRRALYRAWMKKMQPYEAISNQTETE